MSLVALKGSFEKNRDNKVAGLKLRLRTRHCGPCVADLQSVDQANINKVIKITRLYTGP